MRQGFRDIATRIENAESHMAAIVIERTGCNAEQAAHAVAVLRKAKLIKLDAVGGRYIVRHGAALDAVVLRRAIEA